MSQKELTEQMEKAEDWKFSLAELSTQWTCALLRISSSPHLYKWLYIQRPHVFPRTTKCYMLELHSGTMLVLKALTLSLCVSVQPHSC